MPANVSCRRVTQRWCILEEELPGAERTVTMLQAHSALLTVTLGRRGLQAKMNAVMVGSELREA